MIATIHIYGETIRLKASMDWLTNYRRAFREDALLLLFRQIQVLLPVLAGTELETDQINQIFILRTVWAMAKTADPDTPVPDAWAGKWEVFPTGEILETLTDLLFRSSISTVPKKPKPDSGSSTGPVTIDMILAGGVHRGLTIADTKDMTLSEWLDYIEGYDRVFAPSDDEADESREATQADFDRFKRM